MNKLMKFSPVHLTFLLVSYIYTRTRRMTHYTCESIFSFCFVQSAFCFLTLLGQIMAILSVLTYANAVQSSEIHYVYVW